MLDLKIISGAQIGADIAGLMAAKDCGVETGGWITSDARTKAGYIPEDRIQFFNLERTKYTDYVTRTWHNVKNSDGTVRFAYDFDSRGERATLKYIKLYSKPHLDVALGLEHFPDGSSRWETDLIPTDVAQWVLDNNIKVLNIAGNADSSIEELVQQFLILTFKALDN